jgi:hypothetical protein
MIASSTVPDAALARGPIAPDSGVHCGRTPACSILVISLRIAALCVRFDVVRACVATFAISTSVLLARERLNAAFRARHRRA